MRHLKVTICINLEITKHDNRWAKPDDNIKSKAVVFRFAVQDWHIKWSNK